MSSSTFTDKQALQRWEEHRASIRNSTPVDTNETEEEKKARIASLEADPQAWKKYYFPKYFKYESPDFHIKASKRLHKGFKEKRHWYEVRHWARGLSKTTTLMFDVLFFVLTGKLKNIVLCSSTWDAAANFLTKYQCQLDANERIKNDYGIQELPGSWSTGLFRTRKGVQFIALGAGQSPRGNGNEEVRPDCIIVDDFDTDQECRNPELIEQKFKWYEEALVFTVDLAEHYLIVWNGNIIAEDCCVVRAGKKANYCETINIRDEAGNSVWPQKNSDADIDDLESKVSYDASQKELYNNPVSQGKTFKELTYGKCPPLHKLKFAVAYADPSTSNKDKPSVKSKAVNSCKSVVVLGYYNFKYYVYKCWLDNTSQSKFIDWLFAARDFVADATPFYCYIENNSLQDPFYEQVLLPLIHTRGKEVKKPLGVTPDATRKGDKWFRIEADLEPVVRLGTMVFNIDEKDDPHMKRMEVQFKTAKPTSKLLDGPDCTQGAYSKTKEKVSIIAPDSIQSFKRPTNQKRY